MQTKAHDKELKLHGPLHPWILIEMQVQVQTWGVFIKRESYRSQHTPIEINWQLQQRKGRNKVPSLLPPKDCKVVSYNLQYRQYFTVLSPITSSMLKYPLSVKAYKAWNILKHFKRLMSQLGPFLLINSLSNTHCSPPWKCALDLHRLLLCVSFTYQ